MPDIPVVTLPLGAADALLNHSLWNHSCAKSACAPCHPEHHCTAGQSCGRRASRPVGRVLCASRSWPTAIHLGLPLPAASCGLPASSGGPPSNARAGGRSPPSDLAPGGVCLAARITPGAGGLLHHRFTLTPGPAKDRGQGRSAFCGTVPRVAPGRRYRPPCPVEPGPSSPVIPARPPGRLARRGSQRTR
jgi:hypothetical protein